MKLIIKRKPKELTPEQIEELHTKDFLAEGYGRRTGKFL